MSISRMLCLLVCLLFAPTSHAYALSFRLFSADGGFPSQITLGDKESMFLYWRPTEKSLTKCKLTNPKHVIDLYKPSDSNYLVPSNLPFNEGYCSVKVKQVDSQINGTWTLEASAGSKLNYNTSALVNVLSQPVIDNRTFSFIESAAATIKCGRDDAANCRLKSPRGKVSLFYDGPCVKTLYDLNIFEHDGVWQCSFYLKDYIMEFSASTKVQVTEDPFVELVVKEMKDEIVLFCQSRKQNILYSKYCKITTPYGLDLYLSPGKAYGRYTYYGSKPSHCGITIPKPLAHEDIGSWMCQLAQSFTGDTKEIYGGYATIGTEHKLHEVQVESKNIFWTGASMYHILKCHVPYIIEYCWFRSPNGTIYNIPDGIDLDKKNLGFKFGDCVLKVVSIELKYATGEWTCNMGIAKESVTELGSSLHVVYSDIPVIPQNSDVSGELGSTTKLGCESGNGFGIDYCRFIRPDGTGLTVDPIKNNSEYSYQGDGFLYGHCGITIHDLKEHDIGKWVCSFKIHGSNDDTSKYHVQIMVKKEKGSLTAVYIIIGVASLMSLLGVSYFVIRKYEFTIKSRGDDVTVRLIESDESAEDHSNDNLERVNSTIRYVRRRSPRPPTSPESTSSYI